MTLFMNKFSLRPCKGARTKVPADKSFANAHKSKRSEIDKLFL